MTERLNIIESHFTDLWNRIRHRIEETEKSFAPPSPRSGGFLWEHSVHVASIAQQICIDEGIDPFLPVIGALIHDLGKFPEVEAGQKDIPEEVLSIERSMDILESEGMDNRDRERIREGIVALYDESIPKNSISDVVHDADFLSKSGRLGAAVFFQKAALKGKTLVQSLMEGASKEMTYAAVLPENMRTEAGSRMAESKCREILAFFNGLIEELDHNGIFTFKIEETLFPCPDDPGKKVPLILVYPRECPDCRSSFKIQFATKKGVKCRKLIADIRCTFCPQAYETAFCLPEIPGCP